MAKHHSHDNRDARERQANDHTRDASGPGEVETAVSGRGSDSAQPSASGGNGTGPDNHLPGEVPIRADAEADRVAVRSPQAPFEPKEYRQVPLPGMSALDRIEAALKDAAKPYGIPGDGAQERWPLLYEMMTVHQLQNGRSKQVATVSITAHPNGWTASLRDLTLSVGLSADAEHLTDLFDALERLLASPRPPWKQLRHGERASGIKGQDSKLPAPWEPGKKRS